MGDLGQRRRRGTDAPSARTIAERGSRGQHKPPRCGHSERGEGQGPSRSAKCALAPASPPARGSSHRNRNSARPPPRSRRGGTGRDAPRAPRGRTVPLHDGGGAPHGAGTRASHPGRAAAARCLRAGPYHPRPGSAAGARPGGLAACDRGPLCRREHRPWTAALPTHLRHTHTHPAPGVASALPLAPAPTRPGEGARRKTGSDRD